MEVQIEVLRWYPRFSGTKFIGYNPMCLSTVGLMQNLQGGNHSPQFHLGHNNYLAMVCGIPDEELAECPETDMLQPVEPDIERDENCNLHEWNNQRFSQEEPQHQQEYWFSGGSGSQREEKLNFKPLLRPCREPASQNREKPF